MKKLKLKNKVQTNMTMLPNDFIDNYMSAANGEFVKVYLFLLRHLDDPCSSFTVSDIADFLSDTESDVLRAFRYWESAGLISLEKDDAGKIVGIELTQSPAGAQKHRPQETEGSSEQDSGRIPDKKGASASCHDSDRASGSDYDSDRGAEGSGEAHWSSEPSAERSAMPSSTPTGQKEIRSLLFIAEQYLGKTLSHSEMNTVIYFYDTLGMSADLIEYLIENCAENGHKNMRYIQTVALSWAESGITSVSQARERSVSHSRGCFAVINAFGIKGRGLASSELTYLEKWSKEYGFSLDIIQEACRRTISATHQPSFEYADSILTKWKDHGVRLLKDISALDEAFQKGKTSGRASQNRGSVTVKNMNNFERRNYDMDSLEEQLLKSN